MQVVAKYDLHPGPRKDHVACTKLHHIKAAKELSGEGKDQAEGGRKGNWESDGKEGPNDHNTSMRILLDWWMTEGNYSKFCGKNNDGVRKIQWHCYKDFGRDNMIPGCEKCLEHKSAH